MSDREDKNGVPEDQELDETPIPEIPPTPPMTLPEGEAFFTSFSDEDERRFKDELLGFADRSPKQEKAVREQTEIVARAVLRRETKRQEMLSHKVADTIDRLSYLADPKEGEFDLKVFLRALNYTIQLIEAKTPDDSKKEAYSELKNMIEEIIKKRGGGLQVRVVLAEQLGNISTKIDPSLNTARESGNVLDHFVSKIIKRKR